MNSAYSVGPHEVRLNSSGGPTYSVAELTAACPTPFWLMNLDHVRSRARRLKSALKNLPVQIHYAVKANDHARVLAALKDEGIGADVVSAGEGKIALAAGVSAPNIIFSGVAKTRQELSFAFTSGLKQINVESLEELERIEAMALEQKSSLRAPIALGLRLNPNVCPETHPYITTGFRENKFGMDESAIREAVARLSHTTAPLQLRGLSVHIGSQLLDLEAVDEALALALRLQKELRQQSQSLAHMLWDRFDAGGGLGIRYETEDEAQEVALVDDFAACLTRHTEALLHDGSLREIMLEPGRWLVARAGLLITEVQYVKRTPLKDFIIVDAGMNLLLRPTLYEAHHRISPLSTKPKQHRQNFDVVGPICESSDFFARDRELPTPQAGDRLAVFDSGAYGRTMSSDYNRRGPAGEFFFAEGQITG
jgi:diaminopimelate decarboxylase